jgi:hypothetical protein
MIYRRDARNRSLEDFAEARQRTGARAVRRNERMPHAEAMPAAQSAAPALAAAAVK